MSVLTERGSPGRAQIRLRITGLRDAEIAAVIVVLGAVISWFRLPSATRNTLWAEDSRNFLASALHQGPFPPLLTPYAGYLHTVPRLIAGATVTLVPVSGWANAMAAGSCVVVACVAALVFVCARDVVPAVPARLALAALTVLVPTSPREVLGDTANLHWYFLWLAPWLLLFRPRCRAESWIVAIAGLLAALTEIQMALFLPLLLWRWRDRIRVPVRALYLGGVLAQLTATLLTPRGSSSAVPNSWASTAYGYLINCVMTIWIPGSSSIGRLLVRFGPAAGIVCLLPFVAAMVWVLTFGSRRQRSLVGLLAASSVVLWVVAVRTNPGIYYQYASETPAHLVSPWISRYGVVPSLALLAVLVVAMTVRASSRAPRVGPRAVVGAVVLAALLVQFMPVTTRRSQGPEFAPQVQAEARYCIGRSDSTPVVFYSPPKLNWAIHSTCALVESGSPSEPPPAQRAS